MKVFPWNNSKQRFQVKPRKKEERTNKYKTLLKLYNRIWNDKVFPTSWQRAIVIHIAKPGKDPQDAGNYRPIVLTSCLCKLMERMVNARLVYCLEEKVYYLRFRTVSDTIEAP
ncbi:hypothetical protein JTE90_016742 [Oedothorax gibbosus]|uniref:Reverse transcriptase n=1 Tax=Oedothorax gibbosus TaxID=931172 RepID=A0AAV6TPX3_9ARAC|nr:hypothetical protein JTE90_016742 [Oedothorax gibbosus]